MQIFVKVSISSIIHKTNELTLKTNNNERLLLERPSPSRLRDLTASRTLSKRSKTRRVNKQK